MKEKSDVVGKNLCVYVCVPEKNIGKSYEEITVKKQLALNFFLCEKTILILTNNNFHSFKD